MTRMRRRLVPLAGLVLVVGLFGLLEARGGCPLDIGSTHVAFRSASGELMVAGDTYRVGASALLDYMPRALVTPLDQAAYSIRGARHPLTVVASISTTRDVLGDPRFTCVRATRGTDVWMAVPTTFPRQTSIDGYPPGAPSPAVIDAWRLATASGPEWADGDQIALEIWLTVRGERYVIALPPIALMRGG